MEKIPNRAEEEPASLNWLWRPENLDDTLLHGKGHISANQLIDQKAVNDASDYLWYMTRYGNQLFQASKLLVIFYFFITS